MCLSQWSKSLLVIVLAKLADIVRRDRLGVGGAVIVSHG